MPLSRLPRATAHRLIDQLFAPDQRFARCFHRYWRETMGMNDAAATRATQDELATSAGVLRADLADPFVHTLGVAPTSELRSLEPGPHKFVGTHDLGYEPVGMYAVRPLAAHAVGKKLDATMPAGTPGAGARRGLVHAVAIRDDHAGLTVLRTAFVGIARKAVEQDLDVLYFYSSDHRLAGVYKHFGMDFPEGLALPGSRHLVGRYQVHRADNRERVAFTAEQLGLVELPMAA
ncbi:MAG TPA: hypothetical protein VM261_02600 [Kofleriaceae bacterium]|nr:hypothetical protein [Kofleriaceae bacterium]